MQKKLLLSLIIAALSGHAAAGERESMEALRATTLNLINALVEQGVLPKSKADALIKDAETRGAAAAATVSAAPKAGEASVVRVQYVPETVKNEIREQVKREVLAQAKTERWGDPGALPDWISRIKWDGDVRLRYQQDIFQSGNVNINTFSSAYANYQKINEAKPTITSFQQASPDQYFLYTNADGSVANNRDTYKLRARLGMMATVNEDVTASFRITTGSTTTPVSTNQTLGNGLNKYSLVLDRANLRYTPTDWLTLTGGRMDNPWLSTDLIWAPDLGFEGFTAKVRRTSTSTTTPWLTLGAFPLQELGSSSRNKWLYAAQAGVDFELSPTTTGKLGLAVYDYRNIHGELNEPTGTNNNTDFTAPTFVQKGNTMFNIRPPASTTGGTYAGTYLFALASDYRLVNLTGSLNLADFDPVHVWVTGDVVRNIGYDTKKVTQRVGTALVSNPIKAETLGYLAKLSVGMHDLIYQGDWQFSLSYRYLERDAVLDAYTDSDFHLGGTDAKGYVLSAGYAFAKNSWLSLKWMSANEIHGLPLAIDVMQADMNVRF